MVGDLQINRDTMPRVQAPKEEPRQEEGHEEFIDNSHSWGQLNFALLVLVLLLTISLFFRKSVSETVVCEDRVYKVETTDGIHEVTIDQFFAASISNQKQLYELLKSWDL